MADFMDLITQAKKMQEKMKETQEALKKIEVEGISGGNSVRVTMNGDGELKKIFLDDATYKEPKEILEDLLSHLSELNEWSANNIHATIQSICHERSIGFGKVGQPFRLTLSGDGKSGSIDKSAQFVGKKRTLARLKKAIAWINSQNN